MTANRKWGDGQNWIADDEFSRLVGQTVIAHAIDCPGRYGDPDDLIHRYAALLAKCESPIEEIMAAILIGKPKSLSVGEHKVHLDVSSQVWIEPTSGERFRADFVADLTFVPEGGIAISRRVVIECDGHTYHERTPDQARRDRRRDRRMVVGGITVLRYTRDELVLDPVDCSGDVYDVLVAIAAEVTAIRRGGAG